MSLMLRLLSAPSRRQLVMPLRNSVNTKIMPVKEDKSFVESNAEKLCKHVCINYLIEGEEPGPKILPDKEYPDWLFKLDLRPKRELEDMDPEVDGWLYWKKYHKRQREQAEQIKRLTFKRIHLQNSSSLKKPKFWTKKYP